MCALVLGLAGYAAFGSASRASAAAVRFLENDVRSVFWIDKSENTNQVHYGIHLDAACRPQSNEPIYVYWHERERGPQVFTPLLPLEHSAYGIDSQRVIQRLENAGRVSLRLRAFRRREVLVESYRDESRSCRSRAVTAIDDQRSVLESVFVRVGSLFSVHNIQLKGKTLHGVPVHEIYRP